jgi:hypothetical protein
MTCAVVMVELRGFEPLTPCMPSKDPHHGAHHEPLRSRPLPQSSKADEWWFVRVRRAELLRRCCADITTNVVDCARRCSWGRLTLMRGGEISKQL